MLEVSICAMPHVFRKISVHTLSDKVDKQLGYKATSATLKIDVFIHK